MLWRLSFNYLIGALFYLLVALFTGIFLMRDGIAPKSFISSHAHLALVGFVTFTIIGTMNEQIKVLSGRELKYPKLAEVPFYLINLGVWGFVVGLSARIDIITRISSILMFLGILSFSFNILMTSRMKRTGNLTISFYEMAVIYLAAAAFMGTIMVFQPTLLPKSAHAHLALLGFVSMTIVGAMHQMFSMVVLKDLYSSKLGNYVFWLFNLGILGFITSIIGWNPEIRMISGGIIMLAAILFGTNIFFTSYRMPIKIKGTSKSVEAPYFEASILYFLASIIFGISILMGIGIKNSFFMHTHLAMLGWFTMIIYGGFYHVVPLLAWSVMAGKRIGERLPSFKELYDERLARIGFYLSNLGIIGLMVSLPFSLDFQYLFSALILIGAVVFIYDIAGVIKVAK